MRVVNLKDKMELVKNPWEQKIIGELNGQYVKLYKLIGEFVWHNHEDEDELFFVIKGTLGVQFRDREEVTVKEGEVIIIPKGIEHKTIARQEVHVLLFEPISTINTGNVLNENTRIPDQLENI